MKHKILAVLLSANVIFTQLPANVNAASGITLSADSVTAECSSGTEITVPVRAEQNGGYAAGTVDVRWDKTALTLKSVTYTETAPSNSPAAITQGMYRVSIGNYQATENFTATGEFFLLNFTVTDTAEPGDYEIALENASLYDADLNAVPATLKAGTVTLSGALSETDLVLEAGSAEAVAGSGTEIRVPVTAVQNPGYAAGTVDIKWDKTALTLKAVEYSDKAPANSPAVLTQGTYRVSFGDYQATEDFKAAGEFFTLVFEASAAAVPGAYPITLENASLYDTELNAVPVSLRSGTITLTGAPSETDLVLEAGSAEAIIGSGTEIRIPVRAAQNPGYAAGTVDVRWDKTALTLKAVEYSDKAPANSPASLTQGTYRVSFGDYQARENFTAAGEFFTLVFTAADTAAAGTYPVTLDNASVYDAALNAVPVTFKAGKVVLTEKTVSTTTTTKKTTMTTTVTTTTSATKKTTTTTSATGSTSSTKKTTTTTSATGSTSSTKKTTTTASATGSTSSTKKTTTTASATGSTSSTKKTTTATSATGSTSSTKKTTTTTSATGSTSSTKKTTTTTSVTGSTSSTKKTTTTASATGSTSSTKKTTTTASATGSTSSTKKTTTTTSATGSTSSTKKTTTTTTVTTTTSDSNPPATVDGDCNGDGRVSAADAVLLARFASEDETLTQKQISGILNAKPDRNKDGFVTITDVFALLGKPAHN